MNYSLTEIVDNLLQICNYENNTDEKKNMKRVEHEIWRRSKFIEESLPNHVWILYESSR